MARQKEGSLSKKRIDEEFYSHLKYKQQIMKVGSKKKLPKMNGRTGLLPPLDSSAEPLGEAGDAIGVNYNSNRVLSFQNRQTQDLPGGK
jgi:hypothetical protein